MVGERRVRSMLQKVRQGLLFARTKAGTDRKALRSDPDRLDAFKYRIQNVVEGCINVAQHLCAVEGWGPPATNADAMRVLARNGVLPSDLAETMQRAVGLRNLLVHEYGEIDDDRVVAGLDDLDDIEAFLTAVGTWVDAHPEAPAAPE